MEFSRIAKGRGYKYAINNNLFSQYSVRKGRRYLQCDKCIASGYIDGDNFVETKGHTHTDDMAEEIQRLLLLEKCRKRAADEPTESLRRIFNSETSTTTGIAAYMHILP